MAIPTASDWRWMHHREDSPWYPTMRVFRQQEAGNWKDVFARITRALEQRILAASQQHVDPTTAQLQEAGGKWQEGVNAVKQGRFGDAVDEFRIALQFHGGSASIHHDLGVALAQLQRLPEAFEHFRLAIELDPQIVGVYGNMGLAYLQMGKMEEAVAMLRKGIRLGVCSADIYNNLGVALYAVNRNGVVFCLSCFASLIFCWVAGTIFGLPMRLYFFFWG